jgi:hypothetical protein
MFAKSGCKCHRCVARRRLNFTLAVALFALIPIGYLALPDHWQSPRISVSSAWRESRSQLTENDPKHVAQPGESKQRFALAATPVGSVATATPARSVVSQTKQGVFPSPSPRSNAAHLVANSSTVAGRPPIANFASRQAIQLPWQLEKEALANNALSDNPIASQPSPFVAPSREMHSFTAASPARPVAPQEKQAVAPTPSPGANPADLAADSKTIATQPSTANPASPPAALFPPQVEKEALANNALSSNPIASQSAPLVVLSPTETVPFPNITSASPALNQDFEPRGYITVESRVASPRTSVEAGHGARLGQPRPESKPTTPAPHENIAEASDNPAEARGALDKVEQHPPGDLQRFALDFVQTDMSQNVASEHRFYAESVHFFNEGNLSWSGVAAATRRYHEDKQNRQFQVAGTPVVKGPVNGGFYVIEQPVTWSQRQGSALLRGRSTLRLRVLATGRGGWKITAIEEVSR